MIEVTWQSLITAGAVISAVTLIVTLFVKGVRWFDRQNAQDSELDNIREEHRVDIANLKSEESARIKEINEEQILLTYGILACLKGLKEQGCNGPVTDAINKIEKHLNQKAHE